MLRYSRRKLKPADAQRFLNVDPPLFREVAAVVCSTGMLPHKELHECWHMAQVVHQAFPDTLRIADIAAGHGLLGWILVLLGRMEATPVARTAVALDIHRPDSADRLAAAFLDRWPELKDTLHYVEGSVDAVAAGEGPATLLVGAHACGGLSDLILIAALASGSPVALMPCCHSFRKQADTLAQLEGLSGVPRPASEGLPSAGIDRFRREVLAAFHYDVREDSIPEGITAFPHIILGRPSLDHPQPRIAPSVAGRMVERGQRSGAIRAYEQLPRLNVADLEQAQILSERPSREWRRFFDLSYWMDDATMGERIGIILQRLAQGMDPDAESESCEPEPSLKGQGPLLVQVSIQDRYVEPDTGRLAFTYRVEMKSSTVALDREHAIALRSQLCAALDALAVKLHASYRLREPSRQDPA